ncbi:MAG: hypothetical protein KJO32_10235, partial [Deltaproteobacteria bacterium]|nr:hypothetical protein [Deltaproteobacteria bacterium]
ATPSLILVGKNVYHPHERILFSVREKTDMKPKVECFNRGQWNAQCPGDLRVRRSGDKYILQPATPGKYRLRMGKVYSQVFEVNSIRSVRGKSAVPSTVPKSVTEKVADDTKRVKTKKSMPPKSPPRLSLRKTTFRSPARVTLNVQSSPGFKITYVLQKIINGSFKDISSSNKPEFNIEAPGKYQARAHYDNGSFSTPVSFEVQKTKLVKRPAAFGTEQPSVKKQRKTRAIKTKP